MSQERVVTQAYGREDIKQQALYAVWSALAWSEGEPLDVHVYTDDAAWLAPVADRVSAHVLPPEQITAWRGPGDFVHRLKVEMIRDLVRRFPDGKLLYVDADVVFRASPRAILERVGPGRALLHVREYDILKERTNQLRRFRRRMRRIRVGGAPLDLAHGMWNAGAIGLDATHYPLVDVWLALVDEVYAQWPYWVHEQWAISHLLERSGVVSPADDAIVHYWHQKDDAVKAIARELEVLRTRPLGEALAHLRARPLELPPHVPGERTFLQRIADALSFF